MASLFEVIDTYHNQLAALQDSDMPENCINDTIESIQGDVETKIRAVVAFALQLKGDAELRKEQAKRMQASATAMQNRYEVLMTYAQINLMNSGLKLPLVMPEFTVGLAKLPPSLDVIHEDKVPQQYQRRECSFEIPPSMSTEDVKKAIEKAIGVTPVIDTVIDRRTLLDQVKANPDAHKSYARLQPTAYRVTVK